MIWSILIIVAVTILTVPTVYAFYIGAPILLVPKDSIRQALKFCQVKKGQTFYDLGSGTGRSVILADKEFELVSVGLELSPILVLFSKANLLLHKSSAEIRMENFYKADLSQSNIVFCFLLPQPMKKLIPKFLSELKKGTKIISYCFKIPGWEPIKIIDTDNPGKVFIYER